MMTVRAKFHYAGIKTVDQGNGKRLCTLEFYPVYGEGENTKFWEATPSGKIELGMVNEEAIKQFELGKDYYIDFTEAPPPKLPPET